MLQHKITTALAVLKTKFSRLRETISAQISFLSNAGFGMIVVAVAVLLILYYPLGAWLTDNIDRDTEIEIAPSAANQSQTVEMISFIVNREVNEKIWTPNLPFFFPAAILDNMPNFQLGIINGVSKFTTAFEKRIDNKIRNKENSGLLYRAAALLRFPGTVWMFDPHNKIKLVPSAGSQYRKARRMLTKYNQSLINGETVFYKNPQDLAYMLNKVRQNLAQSSNQLTASVRENSSNWLDFKADDVFYYNQGKVYAYYLLFKALAYDYKTIIVDYNMYQNWTSLSKALEEACFIRPAIVRNGELNSSFAPNHLAYLNAYILKAQNYLGQMVEAFQHPLPQKENK